MGNFFSSLFGLRKQKEKTQGQLQEIKLSSSLEWIDSRSSEARAEFVSGTSKKFSEARALIREARSCLKEIEGVSLDSEEAGNPRLRKIVGTSKSAFIGRMDSLLRKLMPPDSGDFSQVRKYCLEASAILQSETNSMGKSIAYTGILLKSELRKFAEALKELDSVLSGLYLELQKNARLQAALRARTALSELVAMKREAIELEKTKIPLAKNSLELSLTSLESLKGEISSLSSSKEMQEHDSALSELTQLREQKSLLRQKFFQSISKADKALKRMGQQCEAKKFILPKEKALLLGSYISDSFQAFESDAEARGLKELLSELMGAIEKNIVEFKPEEKQKRLEAISGLLASGSLEKIFLENSLLENQASEAQEKTRKSNSRAELEALKRRAEVLEKNISEERLALARLQENAALKEKEFLPKKEEAEKILGEFCGSKVNLV